MSILRLTEDFLVPSDKIGNAKTCHHYEMRGRVSQGVGVCYAAPAIDQKCSDFSVVKEDPWPWRSTFSPKHRFRSASVSGEPVIFLVLISCSGHRCGRNKRKYTQMLESR